MAEVVGRDTASTGAEAGAEACQGALTQKQTLWGGGALERGHGAPLEPLAHLGDALSGVGAATHVVDAAELVGVQAVKAGRGGGRCQGALTQALGRTAGSWFEVVEHTSA